MLLVKDVPKLQITANVADISDIDKIPCRGTIQPKKHFFPSHAFLREAQKGITRVSDRDGILAKTSAKMCRQKCVGKNPYAVYSLARARTACTMCVNYISSSARAAWLPVTYVRKALQSYFCKTTRAW